MSESPLPRLALVTGASGGIGAACASALARAGFRVAIHCHRNAEAARALAAALPGDPFVLQCDLSAPGSIDRIHDELKARGPLEALVNNAGIAIDAPLFSADATDFDRMVETNMRAAWLLTKRLSRLMIRRRSGSITQISSVVASAGNVGQSGYAMTKAALEALTRCAAIELAPYGIRVNAIAPGFVDTPMTAPLPDAVKTALLSRIPLGRMGEASEIAEWVEFLATRGTYATGSVFHVNGGLYAGG